MKISTLILTFLIVFILTTVFTDGRRERQLHITSLTIQFDKADAIFTANFNFDKLSKTYLLVFGSKSLEPKVRSIFSNFDYEIIKIDQDKTVLRVKNISRLEKGYYLHDSRKFGETIDIVYIYSSESSSPKEYFNINSTPYFFYRS